MVASLLIMIVSAVLLVYWFRYICLLMLRAQTDKEHAADLASINQLSFAETLRRGFHDLPAGELDSVEKALERDYRLLTHLLRHTTGLEVRGISLEQRMLMADFMVMRLLSKTGRMLGHSGGRAALEEMSLVLNRLADAMAERIHAARVTTVG
jgi:hypothetical protein